MYGIFSYVRKRADTAPTKLAGVPITFRSMGVTPLGYRSKDKKGHHTEKLQMQTAGSPGLRHSSDRAEGGKVRIMGGGRVQHWHPVGAGRINASKTS